MEFGVVSMQHYRRSPADRMAEWVRGLPKRSIWTGKFKVDARDRLQLASMRCKTCGVVELYAPEWSNTCRGCNYDRSGLPLDASCPECGAAAPGAEE